MHVDMFPPNLASIAQKSLQIQVEGVDPIPAGRLGNGRVVFHWSFYVQMAGAVGGIIILVAGLVILNPALIVPGAFFAVSSLIGAYYNHTFSEYSDLETYVTLMSERIEVFANQITNLQTLNYSLQKEMKDHIAHDNEQNSLATSDVKRWVEREKALEEEVSRLSKIASDATTKGDKADKDLQEYVTRLEAQIASLKIVQSQKEASAKGLGNEINMLKESNDDLQNQIKTHTSSLKTYMEQIAELKRVISNLNPKNILLTTRELAQAGHEIEDSATVVEKQLQILQAAQTKIDQQDKRNGSH